MFTIFFNIIVTFCTVMILFLPNSALAANLILSQGWETDTCSTSGWDCAGTYNQIGADFPPTRSTEQAHSGTYSLKSDHVNSVIRVTKSITPRSEVYIEWWWQFKSTWNEQINVAGDPITKNGIKFGKILSGDKEIGAEIWFKGGSHSLQGSVLNFDYTYGSNESCTPGYNSCKLYDGKTYIWAPNAQRGQSVPYGSWTKIAMYAKSNTAGSDNGIFKYWVGSPGEDFDPNTKTPTYSSTTYRWSSLGTATFNKLCITSNIGDTVYNLDKAVTYVDDIEIWDGMPGSSKTYTPPPTQPVDSLPTVSILSPTTQSTYFTDQPSINLQGTASDDNSIQSVTWSDNYGNSGTVLNTSGDFDTWTASLDLREGLNEITLTAKDSIGQTTVDRIAVTYELPGTSSFTSAWMAETQAGTSTWTDSNTTWCVRLLVQGSTLLRSGNEVLLGFQGRKSGDYSVKKVSIAERDSTGGEGDIIDNTWTQVTFDGSAVSNWDSASTTVPQGGTKLSDPISFPLESGRDYYVTFLLTSPSDYLMAQPGNPELYFAGADHASDLDWSGNGYSTYDQRIHGLSTILSSGALLPSPAIMSIR